MAAVQSVVTPQAPIKSAPHAAASLDTEALFGETVTVDECENGFSHVVLGTDGYRGWMPSACLGGMPDVTHQVIVCRIAMSPLVLMSKAWGSAICH